MCGFAGILNSKNKIDKLSLKHYAEKVSFRGPDSCGLKILNSELLDSEQGRHALFFNRLAIVDLDPRSNQPFEDDQHLLIFNGEIYNYRELKTALQRDGIQFHTESDTEVLFYMLRQKGIQALPELNGMFSFFWLDKKEKKFLLGRDRLGIKPLYYSLAEGSLCFGSELHSILRLKQSPYSISREAVEMYLWMQFVPTPYTAIEGIAKLPPGHYLAGHLDKIGPQMQSGEYWDAYDFIQSGTASRPGASLETVLKDSLERQLHADVPLGLFLSSGVDSSLLAALVNKYFAKDQDVNFFTVAFDEDTASNESADAENFIRGFKNSHLKSHLLHIDAKFIEQHLDNLYEFYDEPFGDPAAVLNWVISAKAREHVTVAISGDGADELFWGYARYNKWQSIRKLNVSPAVSKVVTISSSLIPSFETRTKIQRAFRPDPVTTHFDLFLMPAFRPYLRDALLKNIWAMEETNGLKRRKDLPAILDLKTYLADGMLYKVDRSSMATSLEVRVPYLDNEVLDYALTLSFEEKSNGDFENKAALKKLLSQLAPHYNIHQPKKGFSFPLKEWLIKNWRDRVLDNVTPSALTDLGLDGKKYHTIVSDFYEKGTGASVEVWYLFNLVLWKRHIDSLNNRTR